MDRRTFVSGVTCGLAVAPFPSNADVRTPVRRIGVLAIEAPPTQVEMMAAAAPMRALGWVEGKSLLVERRYVDGRVELLKPLAEELVGRKVELIGTLSTAATLAAKNATNTIPIIIWSAGDPVGSGLVASLSRPGGNITGLSLLGSELDAKRLSLLRELFPRLLRVGVLENSANSTYRAKRGAVAQACQSLGMQPVFVEVAPEGDLDSAIKEAVGLGAQALMVPPGDLFYARRVPLLTAALKYALPTAVADKDMLQSGALTYLSYSEVEQNERFASFVDRVLRGAKAAELPMEQPTRFELGISLKTSRVLGLTVPRSVLLRADSVIN